MLLKGPSGVKTHLAVALGVCAVENGSSATFCRLEDLARRKLHRALIRQLATCR